MTEFITYNIMYSVIKMRGLMTELIENNIVLVDIDDVRYFSTYCRIHGLYPSGGALTDDCKSQYLYI